MLSKNASLVYKMLKENSQGFIPVNVQIEGLSRDEITRAIVELYDNNLVKRRECQGEAIELNYSKVLFNHALT